MAGIPGKAKSPFNFNGYTDGELTLTVPEGSTVVMNFVNEDGTPHSAQVIPDKCPIPNMALDQPAIPRAYIQGRRRRNRPVRDRRPPLQGGPGRELPDLLRRAGPWAVGDVDSVQGERRCRDTVANREAGDLAMSRGGYQCSVKGSCGCFHH